MTAADRVLEIFDTESSIVGGDARARRSHAGHCGSSTSTSTSPTPTSSCCATSTSRCRRARRSRSSARPAPARRRSPVWCRGCTTSPAAGSPSTASTSASSPSPRLRDDRRDRLRGADAVLDERARERHARPARRQRRRHRRRDRDRPGRRSSTTCRGASTPGSASRACRCPVASASGWRWPAPSSPSRGSWSSTTPCRRSTSTPRRWSRRRLRRVLAQATGIVVAHRASTVMLADRVALLQGGTITHVGMHHELLATVPAYRDLLGGDADEDDVGVASRGGVAMTTTSTTPPTTPPTEPARSDWRGVAAETPTTSPSTVSAAAAGTARAGCWASCCGRTSGPSAG